MRWLARKTVDSALIALSGFLSAAPNLPGKTRLGRTLLRPFLSRAPAVVRDRAGCTYVLPSYAEPIAQQIFTFGAYEPETRNVILEFLPDEGCFIDVGANIGALAIPIAAARPRVSIICVEADPDIFQFLDDNVKRNDCTQNSNCLLCGWRTGWSAHSILPCS